MFVIVENNVSDHRGERIVHGLRLASTIIFETQDKALEHMYYLYSIYGPNGRRVKELV